METASVADVKTKSSYKLLVKFMFGDLYASYMCNYENRSKLWVVFGFSSVRGKRLSMDFEDRREIRNYIYRTHGAVLLPLVLPLYYYDVLENPRHIHVQIYTNAKKIGLRVRRIGKLVLLWHHLDFTNYMWNSATRPGALGKEIVRAGVRKREREKEEKRVKKRKCGR